jgi:pilus assembly protein TadC
MGLIAARRVTTKGAIPIVIMVLAFVAVGLLHISLPLVVLVLGAISVALSYYKVSRA